MSLAFVVALVLAWLWSSNLPEIKAAPTPVAAPTTSAPPSHEVLTEHGPNRAVATPIASPAPPKVLTTAPSQAAPVVPPSPPAQVAPKEIPPKKTLSTKPSAKRGRRRVGFRSPPKAAAPDDLVAPRQGGKDFYGKIDDLKPDPFREEPEGASRDTADAPGTP